MATPMRSRSFVAACSFKGQMEAGLALGLHKAQPFPPIILKPVSSTLMVEGAPVVMLITHWILLL